MDPLGPPEDEEEGPGGEKKKTNQVFPVVARRCTLNDLSTVLKHNFHSFNQLVVVVDNMENRLLLGSASRAELSRAYVNLREKLRLEHEKIRKRKERDQEVEMAKEEENKEDGGGKDDGEDKGEPEKVELIANTLALSGQEDVQSEEKKKEGQSNRNLQISPTTRSLPLFNT